MSLSDYKNVFVFVEQKYGEIQKVSLELIGKGRELAGKLDAEVTAVVLGNGLRDQLHGLIHQGADNVLYVEDEKLHNYMTEPYTKVLSKIIEEKKPEIFLVGATAIGRDLGPRVSARIHTGLTADCTSLEIDEEEKNLLMTRPAFGGNIMATIICPDFRPQMATVRPGVMQAMEVDSSRTGKVEDFHVELTSEDMNVEILEVVREEKHKVNISEANVLVSGGRGMGNADNFHILDGVAAELNGLVSGSRAVVDAGWLGHERQVGQTGQTVRPDLYIACGISGAIQHVAGMEQSEFIVAINKNETAPIFEVADVGIVGDVNKVIPAVVEELKAYKASQN